MALAGTSPIIGLRTVEQLDSRPSAMEVDLLDDLPDVIDAAVPPCAIIGAAEAGYASPAPNDPLPRPCCWREESRRVLVGQVRSGT